VCGNGKVSGSEQFRLFCCFHKRVFQRERKTTLNFRVVLVSVLYYAGGEELELRGRGLQVKELVVVVVVVGVAVLEVLVVV